MTFNENDELRSKMIYIGILCRAGITQRILVIESESDY